VVVRVNIPKIQPMGMETAVAWNRKVIGELEASKSQLATLLNLGSLNDGTSSALDGCISGLQEKLHSARHKLDSLVHERSSKVQSTDSSRSTQACATFLPRYGSLGADVLGEGAAIYNG
jgi:hypothetical protein